MGNPVDLTVPPLSTGNYAGAEWLLGEAVSRARRAAPGVKVTAELRGAGNANAKRFLGWNPKHPSWRQGFEAELTHTGDSWAPSPVAGHHRRLIMMISACRR
ncbi:hypothetical protein [Kribbella sp. NPDC049227]|uniref:hypothetical protein n=1 Tax=Kribbella sp. NPDC049227 TaxID=3364113 RepID=UPI0037151646